ncbi:MAG: LysM peptidoglycan-binding domain-containing protein [Pseudomonadota bacterium]
MKRILLAVVVLGVGLVGAMVATGRLVVEPQLVLGGSDDAQTASVSPENLTEGSDEPQAGASEGARQELTTPQVTDETSALTGVDDRADGAPAEGAEETTAPVPDETSDERQARADPTGEETANDQAAGTGTATQHAEAEQEPEGERVAALPEATVPAEDLAPASEPDLSTGALDAETDPVTEGDDPDSAESEGADAAGDDPNAPRLDVVRVSPDGMAVIAGAAAPGAVIDIVLDGETIETVQADDAGGFVVITDVGAVTAPRALQLRVSGAGSEPSALETAEAAGQGATSSPTAPTDSADTGTDIALGAAADLDARENDRDQLQEVAGDAPGAPLAGDPSLGAPIILLPTDDASAPRIVGTAGGEVALLDPAAVGPQRLVLDTLSYAEGGEGRASGRGPADATVRAYADNQLAASAAVSPSGSWALDLPAAVLREASLLRFDEIGPDGSVRHRLETRFSYRSAGATLGLRERTVRVEKGDSLWRIAESAYGDGWRYSVIFSANDALIADPDLIYPDQEFVVPELIEQGATE